MHAGRKPAVALICALLLMVRGLAGVLLLYGHPMLVAVKDMPLVGHINSERAKV